MKKKTSWVATAALLGLPLMALPRPTPPTPRRPRRPWATSPPSRTTSPGRTSSRLTGVPSTTPCGTPKPAGTHAPRPCASLQSAPAGPPAPAAARRPAAITARRPQMIRLTATAAVGVPGRLRLVLAGRRLRQGVRAHQGAHRPGARYRRSAQDADNARARVDRAAEAAADGRDRRRSRVPEQPRPAGQASASWASPSPSWCALGAWRTRPSASAA